MSRATELSEAHWNGYVGPLVDIHMASAYTREEVMRLCAFHYKTAFVHGFKHGVDEEQVMQAISDDVDKMVAETLRNPPAHPYLHKDKVDAWEGVDQCRRCTNVTCSSRGEKCQITGCKAFVEGEA